MVGFSLTMVGNLVELSWKKSNDESCSFCKDTRGVSEMHIKNFSIAGPIVLVLDIVLIIVACVMRRRGASKAQSGGLLSQPVGGYTTLSYSTADQIGTSTTPYQPSGTNYLPPPADYSSGISYTPSTTLTYPAHTCTPNSFWLQSAHAAANPCNTLLTIFRDITVLTS